MEFAAMLLLNSIGVMVGIGLVALLRHPKIHWRLFVASLLAALLGFFLSGVPFPFPALGGGLHLPPMAAHLATILCLLLTALTLTMLSRWLTAAGFVALYAVDIFLLLGFYPGSGWGLVAVPPLLAGVLIATAPARRRGVQFMLALGWLLVVLAPATMALMNTVDQLDWERARATTGYHQNLSPEQIATLVSVVHQREVGATALYLLVTLGTLGLISIALVERLIDAPRQAVLSRERDRPLQGAGEP